MSARRILLSVALLGLLAGHASAQDSLQAAKDLYASASYEDALAILTRLERTDAPVEVQQYRAFCLIALGRLSDAEHAIESVVVADPKYAPGGMDAPPRIQEIFSRTRKQLLPEIARLKYTEAKRDLDRKDREAAIAGFGSVVEIIDAADGETRQSLDELRFLAVGFFDLATAMTAPRPSKPSEAADLAAEQAWAVTPPLDFMPPVAIRQVMPAWIPADEPSRQTTFSGVVRVRISAAGRVEGAQMVRPVHPAYDRLLLEAARNWEYQPARRGGIQISSEQIVEVQLKPRR